MDTASPESLAAKLPTEQGSQEDWQSWRWDVGDQPGHSPRYAVIDIENADAKTLGSGTELGSRPEGADAHTITLGWFHRYPARFAADVLSSVMASAFARSRRPVNTILDPFCGTGTVLAASRQMLCDAVGIELTTLGQIIGSVRLHPSLSISDALTATLELLELNPASHSEINSELEHWMGPVNALRLTAWLNHAAKIDDIAMRNFVYVAISQSLRPASRWLAGSIKVQADPKRIPSPIEQVLPRFARQLAKDCFAERDSSIAAARTANRALPNAVILAGDGQRLPLRENAVDIIVTSPPYFVTYDYFDVHRLTYLAFGWNKPRYMQLGTKYGHSPNGVHAMNMVPSFAKWYTRFGQESSVLGRALRAYHEGFARHATEALRVVAPGGLVAYSVANSVRQGEVFDLVTSVKEILTDAGFVNVEATPRPQAGRRILPPGRDTATGRFAGNAARAGVREYLIYGTSP